MKRNPIRQLRNNIGLQVVVRERPLQRIAARVKLADLLPQDTENVNTSSLKPRRPEHVGRPANRPRVKLSDLLLREAEHIAAREVDPEMQMDNEV